MGVTHTKYITATADSQVWAAPGLRHLAGINTGVAGIEVQRTAQTVKRNFVAQANYGHLVPVRRAGHELHRQGVVFIEHIGVLVDQPQSVKTRGIATGVVQHGQPALRVFCSDFDVHVFVVVTSLKSDVGDLGAAIIGQHQIAIEFKNIDRLPWAQCGQRVFDVGRIKKCIRLHNHLAPAHPQPLAMSQHRIRVPARESLP